MARRALLIANPKSRQGDGMLSSVKAALEAAGLTVDARPLRRPPDLPDLIAAGAPGADLVVLAGGDGTFNCGAEAIMAAGLPLGLIPAGTANDLARTLGIPLDPVAAAEVIVRGHRRRVDLGSVNDKPFFNVANIGFGVVVAQKHTDDRKKRFGVAAYALSVRDAFAAHEPFWCEIVCDGRTERHRLDQLAVGNGRHYGGGLTVAEGATIDDGLLDLYGITPLPWWQVVALLPRLRFGLRPQDPGALLMRGRTIEIRTDPPLPISTDGELTGTTPAQFGVLREAVEIFIPGGPTPPGLQ